jgi:hypothetical protein
MKIVITENKVFETIYRYLDKNYNPKEIDWVYGVDDAEDEYSEPKENENFLIFYEGYYLDEYESNVFFHYFNVDYYSDESSDNKDEAPILEVIGEYAEQLDNMFDIYWHEPMKKWFQDNFNLPVNTVSAHYSYYSKD